MRRKPRVWLLGSLLALGLVACSDDDGGNNNTICGNGAIDGNEVCDGANLDGESCESQGFIGGSLACNATCTGFVTTGCQSTGCGDGVIQTPEACDGTALGEETCLTQGFDGGELACTGACELDLSGCTGGCGNGVAEPMEDCDGADLRAYTCQTQGYESGTLACAANCALDTSGCTGNSVDVSNPCDSNDDCLGGTCFLETQMGVPGGYCTAEVGSCVAWEPCTQQGTVCAQTQGGDLFCTLECDVANPDCRDGLACIDVNGDGSLGLCWAGCTDNSQCTTTGLCDTESGFCTVPPEDCANTTDDDFDGLADCADPDCNATCPSGEDCTNGTDDDSDGLADCADGECATHIACSGSTACVPVTPAPTCDATLTALGNDDTGSTNAIGSWCGSDAYYTGPEIAWHLTVAENTIVTVNLTNLNADVDLIVLRDDGSAGACNPDVCYTASMNVDLNDETATFEANPGYDYYIGVDGYDGAVATFDFGLICAQGEICNNAADDDGDGLDDCDDPSCFGQTGCTVETNCGDGQDNDLDGDVDCDDTDCASDDFCSSPAVFSEGFDTWPPASWTVTDVNTDGNTWSQCDGCGRATPPGAAGAYAIADSDAAGSGIAMDEYLTTPAIDLTGSTSVFVTFLHFYQDYDDTDMGVVEYSTDGTNWTTIATYNDATYSGRVVLDLSAELANQAAARIRFHYTGTFAWYWGIDSFEVRAQ